MAEHIEGTYEGSLVHKFITSGKPGNCELCHSSVSKLEAHHIKYDPEVTINLCHLCHHKAHFWPNRLSSSQKFLILKRVHPLEVAQQLSQTKFADIASLARLVAPSRQAFIHAAQKLEEKRIAEQRPVEKREPESYQQIRDIPRLSEQ